MPGRNCNCAAFEKACARMSSVATRPAICRRVVGKQPPLPVDDVAVCALSLAVEQVIAATFCRRESGVSRQEGIEFRGEWADFGRCLERCNRLSHLIEGRLSPCPVYRTQCNDQRHGIRAGDLGADRGRGTVIGFAADRIDIIRPRHGKRPQPPYALEQRPVRTLRYPVHHTGRIGICYLSGSFSIP